jgi:hypothetical protein
LELPISTPTQLQLELEPCQSGKQQCCSEDDRDTPMENQNEVGKEESPSAGDTSPEEKIVLHMDDDEWGFLDPIQEIPKLNLPEGRAEVPSSPTVNEVIVGPSRASSSSQPSHAAEDSEPSGSRKRKTTPYEVSLPAEVSGGPGQDPICQQKKSMVKKN